MRFVEASSRERYSLIGEFPLNIKYVSTIRDTKRNKFTWKNLTLMKDPMSLTTYQQLIQELRPKTILEFGSYDGGSALWMNDICQSLDIDCKIYTYDINKVELQHPNITAVTLDMYKFKDYVKDNLNFFEKLPHPILVLEDSHENIFESLSEVDTFLKSGDYIVVEDTMYAANHDPMMKFLEGKDYMVDTLYCDFWGSNNSWNFNSYLMKL